MLQRMKSRISLGLLVLVFTLSHPARAADDQFALTTDRGARQTEQQILDAEEKKLCGQFGSRNESCRLARSRAKRYAEDTTGLETLMTQLERIEQRLKALESKVNSGK